MTILICGRGRVAVDALQHAASRHAAGLGSHRLLACPSGGDDGVDAWQPSLVAAAKALDVPIVAVADVQDDPDLILISLEYDRIIDTSKFASTRLYNIHFSALPAYRGVYTSIWPLLNGETEAGVTLHVIDPGVDTGAIVAQRRFPLAKQETARTLFDRFHLEGTELIVEWLPLLVAGEVSSEPQSEQGASLYRRSDLDVSSARQIDLSQTAEEMNRTARAFYFPEYQTALFRGQGIRACRRMGERAQPSTILAETSRSIVVSASDGEVVELIKAITSLTSPSPR